MHIGTKCLYKLIKNNLSINQYFICCLVIERNFKLTEEYIEKYGSFKKEDLEYLIRNNLIISEDGSYNLDKLSVTPKFDSYFVEDFWKVEKPNNINEWIDEWYELFPKGIKSGNYSIKTDKPSCLKKLKKFQSLYPDFTKEIIIQATKNYVNEFALKGYNYMKLAPYFIEKDGSSTLWGYCNNIIEGDTNNNQSNDMVEDV